MQLCDEGAILFIVIEIMGLRAILHVYQPYFLIPHAANAPDVFN